MELTMDEGLNNFFSRGDLGGVNPELLECELKLYNVKDQYKILQAKVLQFYKRLEDASKLEHREGEIAEFWAEAYKQWFDIQIHTHGTTEE